MCVSCLDPSVLIRVCSAGNCKRPFITDFLKKTDEGDREQQNKCIRTIVRREDLPSLTFDSFFSLLYSSVYLSIFVGMQLKITIS